MKTMSTLLIAFIACFISQEILAQVVTNTNDAGAGSLRQAIIDANAGSGNGTIKFNIPDTDPNYDISRGVFVISVQSTLPVIMVNKLDIDGATQSNFTANTNPIMLGTGGEVGIENLTLDKIEGPEIEIVGQRNIKYGLKIDAPGVSVKNLAIFGFASKSGSANANIIFTDKAHNGLVQGCIIGTYADQLTDPDTARSGGNGIVGDGADSVTVRNNIIAYQEVGGIYLLNNADVWQIENNEIIHNALRVKELDGIDLSQNRECKIIGNKITDNLGIGIDSYISEGYHLIANNTIARNGTGEHETPGIRLYGKRTDVIKNLIYDNTGAGVLITSSATKHRVKKNSMYNNGSVGDNPTGEIGIDLLASKENHKRGKSPFVTQNDPEDYDIGGNGLLNFPVLDSAIVKEGNLLLTGWARQAAELEFFMADTSSDNFPQGKTYLFSLIEGSTDDLDSTVSVYGPVVHGISVGNDSTSRFRFSFPLPNGISLGSVLTATATLDSTTSEFSNAVEVTEELTSVMPIAGCLMINADSSYAVNLGYYNPNISEIEIPYGENNIFSNNETFTSHPTRFAPGLHTSVFTVNYDKNGLIWTLDGNELKLDGEVALCVTNISVEATTARPFVEEGDTTKIRVVIKNTGGQVTHGVTIDAPIPSELTYLASQPSAGSYNTNTWNVGTLNPGDSVVLEFEVKVNENADFTASLGSIFQEDSNELDNSSTVSIGVEASTGGEDGGVESNGNLATKLATRNFKRTFSEKKASSARKTRFTRANVKNGKIKAAGANARTKGGVTPLDFIPENGPASTQAFITTPGDLIGVTNASTVFAVDYLNEKSQRLGAMLAITTTGGELYEHTKVICDRLNGAVLEDIWHTEVLRKPFIIFKLRQPGQEVDYAINFIVKRRGGQFIIDNRWGLEEYDTDNTEEIFNLQIWSTSPEYTKKLLSDFINNLSKTEQMKFDNNYPPVIPEVYVKSGKYENGQIILDLSNQVNATELAVRGTSAAVEDGRRQSFLYELPITSEESAKVSVPVNNVFDAGFSVQNDLVGGMDVLYFADGPWGVDYEKGGAVVNEFYALQQEESDVVEEELLIERKAVMKGEVTTYASLFRYLRPGLQPRDLQAFNQLRFTANGTGELEVILLKKSVEGSAGQYRKTVKLTEEKKEFFINFSELTDRMGFGAGTFKADDVTAIVFNVLGDQQTAHPFEINIENVVFTTQFITATEEELDRKEEVLKIFPNPFEGKTNLLFYLKQPRNAVHLEVLDVLGNKVANLLESELQSGFYEIPVDGKRIGKGVFIVRLTINGQVYAQRIISQ